MFEHSRASGMKGKKVITSLFLYSMVEHKKYPTHALLLIEMGN